MNSYAEKAIRVLRQGKSGPDWPKGFRWDYGECQTCLIGLAVRLWPNRVLLYSDSVGRLLGLVGEERQVFFGVGESRGRRSKRVSPTDVANVLEECLADDSRTQR